MRENHRNSGLWKALGWRGSVISVAAFVVVFAMAGVSADAAGQSGGKGLKASGEVCAPKATACPADGGAALGLSKKLQSKSKKAVAKKQIPTRPSQGKN